MSNSIPPNYTGDQNVVKIMDALKAPFPADIVQFRAGASSAANKKALALAYIEARDVMNRLDEVLGCHCWSSEIIETSTGQVICVLTVEIIDSNGVAHTVKKSDVGGSGKPDSGGRDDGGPAADKLKSAASDAMKRAAIHLGVGRYLYFVPATWVSAEFGADGKCKKLLEKPKLPSWALPEGFQYPAGAGQHEQQAPPQQQNAAPPSGSVLRGQQQSQAPAQNPDLLKPSTEQQFNRLDYLFSKLPDLGASAFQSLQKKYAIVDIRQLNIGQAADAIQKTEAYLAQQKIPF